jgi:FkbM family methyltransferase
MATLVTLATLAALLPLCTAAPSAAELLQQGHRPFADLAAAEPTEPAGTDAGAAKATSAWPEPPKIPRVAAALMDEYRGMRPGGEAAAVYTDDGPADAGGDWLPPSAAGTNPHRLVRRGDGGVYLVAGRHDDVSTTMGDSTTLGALVAALVGGSCGGPVACTVIDVGAGRGAATTIPAARAAGPRATVVALEPERTAFHGLAANVALNGIANTRVLQAAAGAASGAYVPFTPANPFRAAEPPLAAANWTERLAAGKATGPAAMDAEHTVGDAALVMAVADLPLEHCDLLIIDDGALGALGDIIAGAWRVIAEHLPVIVARVAGSVTTATSAAIPDALALAAVKKFKPARADARAVTRLLRLGGTHRCMWHAFRQDGNQQHGAGAAGAANAGAANAAVFAVCVPVDHPALELTLPLPGTVTPIDPADFQSGITLNLSQPSAPGSAARDEL